MFSLAWLVVDGHLSERGLEGVQERLYYYPPLLLISIELYGTWYTFQPSWGPCAYLSIYIYLRSQHRLLTAIGQIKLTLTHWPSLEIHVTWTERRAQVRPRSHRLKHRSSLGQPGLIAQSFYKNSTTEPPTLKSWSGQPIEARVQGGRLGRDFNFVL